VAAQGGGRGRAACEAAAGLKALKPELDVALGGLSRAAASVELPYGRRCRDLGHTSSGAKVPLKGIYFPGTLKFLTAGPWVHRLAIIPSRLAIEPLRAPCAHTKPPYRTDILRRTLRAHDREGGAGPRERGLLGRDPAAGRPQSWRAHA
jgi:hypothetical protein